MQPHEPSAQPSYRVPRTNLDEYFVKDDPPAPVRPAMGTVVGINDDGTVQVNDADEEVTVVPLGATPKMGEQIDYYLVDGLAYTPEPSVGQGSQVFVQPDDPGDRTVGALWFDTDEPVP